MTEQPRGLCRAGGASCPQAVCGPLPAAQLGGPPSCQPVPRPPAPRNKASAKEGLRAQESAGSPACLPRKVLGCSGTGGFWGLKLKLSSPVCNRQGLPFSPHTHVTIKFNTQPAEHPSPCHLSRASYLGSLCPASRSLHRQHVWKSPSPTQPGGGVTPPPSRQVLRGHRLPDPRLFPAGG